MYFQNKYKVLLGFVLILSWLHGFSQISAPGSSYSETTQYPVFKPNDNVYIFCTLSELATNGALRVQTQLQGTKTFLWEKYNSVSGKFEFFSSESITGQSSTISNLSNGCYRATVTLGAATEVYRAWVFNNWISSSAGVGESNCNYFKLVGTFLSSVMKYNDLSTNAEKEILRDIRVQWKDGQKIVSTVNSPQVFDPPTKNTEYVFRVYDKFGCEHLSKLTYNSIVTKASFTIEPKDGEAPLDVTFTNTSENGDAGLYEWFFFRDLNEIKRETENTNVPVDSIMLLAYDDNPIYTYENSGVYMVKLVSKKVSEFHTCVDTFYLEKHIDVDTSFIAVPNVFTPNGDGTNDEFVVKFWSMKEIRISLFNRWGKKIHYWENNDIRGFKNTYVETIWDGRLGGRYASPGVYYYVVEGMGRDGAKRRARGFFHLFREKNSD